MKSVVRVVLVCCFAGSMSAATYFDNDFSSGWTTTVLSANGGATASASIILTGGTVTPPFRQVQHNNASSLFVAHINSAAVWNPAVDGAIASFDYGFDIKSITPPTSAGSMMYSLLFVQAGSYYATTTDTTTSAWATHTTINPTAFTRITGPGSDVPDFSCKGAPITFGYMTKTNLAVAANETSGLDAWNVTVHADPASSCCMTTTEPEVKCNRNGTVTVSTVVTNTSGHSVQAVLVGPPPGATYTVTPNVIPGPFANGAPIPVSVTVSGATPGQSICLRYYLQDTDTDTCCMVERCFVPKCGCMEITGASVSCDPDPSATYAYTFTLHNLTNTTIQQVFVLASPGTVTPQLINTPIPAHGQITVTLHLAGVKAGDEVCIVLQAYPEGESCCTLRICVTMPVITKQCD